jgi:hypothetical protein
LFSSQDKYRLLIKAHKREAYVQEVISGEPVNGVHEKDIEKNEVTLV